MPTADIQNRRKVLGLLARCGALLGTLAAGWLKPLAAMAASAWNKNAFEAKTMAEALKALGATALTESRDIAITAPDVAENGAMVQISVASRIPNTQSIAILAEKNPFPLAAIFNILPGGEPQVLLRLKMGQTSDLRVVVRAENRHFTAAREVKITIGGCG
jgi:sulfur-oxidizing protein SoxY